MKIQIPSATCKRCGHTWLLRKPELPINCPNCKSGYWNKERVRIKKELNNGV